MKNIIIILYFFFYTVSQFHAQRIERSVIGSSGSQFISGNYQLDYTVGECFIQSLNTPNNSITQGFHQGNLIIQRQYQKTDVRVKNKLDKNDKIKEIEMDIFPNPTVDILTLSQKKKLNLSLNLIIIDAKGNVLLQEKMYQEDINLDVKNFPSGIYTLMIKDETENLIQSYKILKLK